MKILLINKFHYERDGGTRAYFDTAEILKNHGHEVAFFSMRHESNLPTPWSKYFVDQVDYNRQGLSLSQKIKAAANLIYNFEAARRLEVLLKEFKPDLAHLHVIYHQLSPAIIHTLRKYEIPMVMTLHDYKFICPNYNLYAHGQIWEKSRPAKYYKVFLEKAVKDSYAKSLVCALEAYIHKFLKVYEQVDLFISPSRFLIDKYKEFGFKNDIVYLPNALIKDKEKKNTAAAAEKYILYFGRLSREKGIHILVKAYAALRTELKLYILGSGPMEKDLRILAEESGLDGKINFMGHRTGQELDNFIHGAEFIVAPSLWFENAPYSVIEAMAQGKVVIASSLGGLKEIIQSGQNGFLYKAGDAKELVKVMNYIISRPEIKNQLGINAAGSVVLRNNQDDFYNKLIKFYAEAASKTAGGRH